MQNNNYKQFNVNQLLYLPLSSNEELTLYIIEQNKQLKNQNQRILKLENNR